MSNTEMVKKSKTQHPMPTGPMDGGLGIYTPGYFEQAQRVAASLAASSLVPESYRNRPENCLIALDMSQRLQANPMAIMQSLYIVHGRPAWASTFVAGAVNTCGRFEPVNYIMQGDGETRSCFCEATVKSTREKVQGPEVTIAMAKAEGWFSKKGSKWQTMPELMLRYRAVTFFGRLYAPEVLLGMQTEDEVIDVQATVSEPGNVIPAGIVGQTKEPEAETEQPKPAKKRTRKPKAPATPPEQQPAPETTSAPDPEPEPEAEQPEVVTGGGELPEAFASNEKAIKLNAILEENGHRWADFDFFMKTEQDYDLTSSGLPMSFINAMLRDPSVLLKGIESLKTGGE